MATGFDAGTAGELQVVTAGELGVGAAGGREAGTEGEMHVRTAEGLNAATAGRDVGRRR